MHALCFMVFKLGLDSFKLILRGPIVCSWLSAGIWERRPPKEATPFPLFVVFELEVAACSKTMRIAFVASLSVRALGRFAVF